MELKISHQDYAILKVDQPKSRQIRGIIVILIGLSTCFISVFIVVFFYWIISLAGFVGGALIALGGIPMVLKEEILIIQPGIKRIEQHSSWSRPFHINIRHWDLNLISSVAAQIITELDSPKMIGLFLKFKNGEQERVLTEIGEKIPYNCIKFVNMMIQDKEVPEGIFRD
ncbi:MAG: hypothetical protein ACFFD2_18195 [Promethearchaeota archaeon]